MCEITVIKAKDCRFLLIVLVANICLPNCFIVVGVITASHRVNLDSKWEMFYLDRNIGCRRDGRQYTKTTPRGNLVVRVKRKRFVKTRENPVAERLVFYPRVAHIRRWGGSFETVVAHSWEDSCSRGVSSLQKMWDGLEKIWWLIASSGSWQDMGGGSLQKIRQEKWWTLAEDEVAHSKRYGDS